MNIELIRIQKIDGKPQLRAFADVMINGSFRVNGFRLLESSKDGYWIGSPTNQYKTKDGKIKFNPIVEICTDNAKDEIQGTIVNAYEK